MASEANERESLSLVVVGDVFPSGRFYVADRPISAHFERTLDLVRGGDLAFANFEMPLSNRGQPLEKLANIRAAPEIAEDVGRLGFDVLSLANNHSMDYGFEAMTDTARGLESQGIRHLGAGAALAEAVQPVVLDVKGWRVGFIAFCCLVPPGGAASDDRPGIAPIHVHSSYQVNPYWQIEEPGEPLMVTIRTWADEADQQFAEECVRKLASEVDFLCLSMHWGYGATENLAEYQRPLAYAMLDAGADVIFGNHAHAIHGIETHKGKAILYSPGTFIGRQPSDDPNELDSLSEIARELIAAMSPDGYLAAVDVAADGGYSLRVAPTSLDENGLPRVVEGDDFERIAERIVRLSAKLGTHLDVRDGALHLEPMVVA